LNISVPFSSIKCADGCDIVRFSCKSNTVGVVADCPVEVIMTVTKESTLSLW